MTPVTLGGRTVYLSIAISRNEQSSVNFRPCRSFEVFAFAWRFARVPR
jgi:hypothetical protein